jgi:pimeloyl-ACP methyl ester carboxylesterase
MGEMGDARPRLVLFPPLGCDAVLYAPLAEALAPDVRVIAIDYPGFDDRPRAFDYRDDDGALLERLAATLAADVRALGDAPVILGGVSLGGTLSYLVAREIRPRAMLLMAPGGRGVSRVRRDAILEAMRTSSPEAFVKRSLGLDAEAFGDAGFASHFPSDATNARHYFDHLVARTWAPAAARARAEAYVALLRAVIDVDLAETMASNRVPTDLVWGEGDRVFPSRVYSRYERELAASTFHLLPGVGHFAPLDAPDALARIVRGRLTEH